MTETIEKVALRNAFSKKLGKTEAESTYVKKTDLESLSAGVDSTILAEQIINFYNGYEDASLDYRDYIKINASTQAEAVYTFGRGYNGEL